MGIVFGTILDGSLGVWTNLIRNRKLGYANSDSKKMFTIAIEVILLVSIINFLRIYMKQKYIIV